MQSANGSPELYEHLLTISFLLFLRSYQLYTNFGKCAGSNPKFIRTAEIQACFKNMIAMLETCGNGIKRLPASPPGVEMVDMWLRALGWEIYSLAAVLKRLASTVDQEERIQIADDIQDRATMIKENFREAILGFENIYPGRLAQVLQSNKHSLLELDKGYADQNSALLGFDQHTPAKICMEYF